MKHVLFDKCCDVCGQTDGAVVFCSSPRCKFAFHPSCGKKEGFYMFIERTNDKKSEALDKTLDRLGKRKTPGKHSRQ